MMTIHCCPSCGGAFTVDQVTLIGRCERFGIDICTEPQDWIVALECAHMQRTADDADADESATDLEERLQLALDRADEDVLDSMTGMTEDERRMLG